jgi:hypothetical protein
MITRTHCPICQEALEQLSPNKRGCPNSSSAPSGHVFHTSDNGGFLVESYLYKGWRIHTAPIHPVLKHPLTSFYLFDYLKNLTVPLEAEPVHELHEYMPSEDLVETVKLLGNRLPFLDLNVKQFN